MSESASATDLELLTRYARDGAEDAFAELVRRHLDLVHSAALRQVRSPQLAEEVAQSAFTDLARNTHRLAPDTIVAAWLYQVTRRTAIEVVRRESRRQLREQIATEMNAMNATSDGWAQIEPLLDDAMATFDDTDRAALLLRYFENKSLREVGTVLGTSDDAAQKRVSRAVDRLREFITKRGVTVGAGGLVVVISANAVQAAPIGLAATISTVAATITGTTFATSATVTTTKAIAMTTLQKTLITATVAILAGAGFYEAHQTAQLREQNQALQQQQSPLAGQLRQLQDERDDATNRLAALLAENVRRESGSNQLELLKLRGLVGVLHRQNGELLQGLQNAEKLNHPSFPTNFVPRDSLAFAGFHTPENALKSGLWAKSIGDEKAWRELTAPEMTNVLNSYVQGNTEEERSQFLIEKTKALTGFRILSETRVAADELLVQTEYDWQANGQKGSSINMEVLKQIDGKWKVYDEYANSDQVAELLNALNSKNSTGADSANTNPSPASPIRVIGQ